MFDEQSDAVGSELVKLGRRIDIYLSLSQRLKLSTEVVAFMARQFRYPAENGLSFET